MINETTTTKVPATYTTRGPMGLEAVREALLRRAAGEFADRPGGA